MPHTNPRSLHLLMAALALVAPACAWAGDEPARSAEEQAVLDEEARLDAEESGNAGGLPGPGRGGLVTPRDPTAPDPAPPHPELRGVLDAFGGEAGLTALMDTFMERLLADARTRPFFENADQQRIKEQLVLQFCAILGGECVYAGQDMKSSHAALGIDRADFNALVEVLQISMDDHDIPFRTQNRLLAKLAPMHREIVTE